MIPCINLSLRRASLAAVALFSLPLAATAQTPLIQWDFADGSAEGFTTTGTTASFTGSGVSGLAGDNAYSVSNAYSGGTASGRAAQSGLNVPALSQFTATMWLNVTAGDVVPGIFPRLLQIGQSATPDSGTNPGLSMLINAGNLEVGVNGFNNSSYNPGFAASVDQWVFIAWAYNGLQENPYFNPTTPYGATFDDNSVVLKGTTTSSVAVVSSAGLNTGAAGAFVVSPGQVSFTSTVTAQLGNRADLGRGFTGSIDDVRLYSGLLTIDQLEGVRLSALGAAIPEPSTYAAIVGALALAGVVLRRRRRA